MKISKKPLNIKKLKTDVLRINKEMNELEKNIKIDTSKMNKTFDI